MQNVLLLTGAGQIGLAIARRVGPGMKIVIGDKKIENARIIAKIMSDAGFDTVSVETDISSRDSIRKLIAEGQNMAKSPCWLMPPASLQARLPLKLSCMWTCTAQPYCWKRWER